MLVKHSIQTKASTRYLNRFMYSIVRDGIQNINDTEFESLLKKGDHTYTDFENTFGRPATNKNISSSKAFRWAFYQLLKRINKSDWEKIWNSGWQNDGWLHLYEIEYMKIKPAITNINQTLISEKSRLAHSVFPLESNLELYKKYNQLISITESLLNDCNLNSIKPYSNNPHQSDFIEQIIYSIGISHLAYTTIDDLYKYELI